MASSLFLFIESLSALLDPSSLLTDSADLLSYSYDNSSSSSLPSAVAFAKNSQQIQAIVKLCNQYRVPLTVRGRATGTAGGAVPIQHGLVLSLERMNQIIKIDSPNRIMVVEPGIINQHVQLAAAKHGFFWAPDPSSAAYCTVGGNLAHNSAGPRAIKYGTPRENVLGLQAITGAAEMIKTGTYTTKGVVGYDLTRLLIGSEGTLAIITEATLKLTPLPETKRTLRAIYRDIRSAATAIVEIMRQPVVPCAIEFMDDKAIDLIRSQQIIISRDAAAFLLIDLEELAHAMPFAMDKIIHAAKNSGLIDITVAENEIESQQLWQARKALSPALRTFATGKINEDIVVPVSHLPTLITTLKKIAHENQITILNFGHAGNGNIHVNLLFDKTDPQACQRARDSLNEVFNLVLKLNGTLSGEHGIGLEKRNFISREIDAISLNLMRNIKKVFDPNHILNPGKLFPDN